MDAAHCRKFFLSQIQRDRVEKSDEQKCWMYKEIPFQRLWVQVELNKYMLMIK